MWILCATPEQGGLPGGAWLVAAPCRFGVRWVVGPGLPAVLVVCLEAGLDGLFADVEPFGHAVHGDPCGAAG